MWLCWGSICHLEASKPTCLSTTPFPCHVWFYVNFPLLLKLYVTTPTGSRMSPKAERFLSQMPRHLTSTKVSSTLSSSSIYRQKLKHLTLSLHTALFKNCWNTPSFLPLRLLLSGTSLSPAPWPGLHSLLALPAAVQPHGLWESHSAMLTSHHWFKQSRKVCGLNCHLLIIVSQSPGPEVRVLSGSEVLWLVTEFCFLRL